MTELSKLLFCEDLEKIASELRICKDKEYLHQFAIAYDWANGFGIPKSILANSACSLGTALLLFYQGDGYRYLTERPAESDLPDWLSFISALYFDIKVGKYTDKSIPFDVPLTNIQIFKLKKNLAKDESVFITNI